jgi:protein-disulfide isomerase
MHGDSREGSQMAKDKPQGKQERKSPPAGGNGRWLVLGAVAVVAVILAGGLIFISQRSGDDTPSAEAVATGDVAGLDEVSTLLRDIPQSGAVLGDPNAPVTITEFADLRCPACGAFATEQLPTVVEDLVRPGKAKFELVIWPVLGPDSVVALQAGVAAQEQDRLHDYAELWFKNQPGERDDISPAFTDSLAGALGLDLQRFRADRDNEALWAPILQDTQVVTAQRGFGGTPSFIVTGPAGEKVISGQVPTAETIAQAVAEVS